MKKIIPLVLIASLGFTGAAMADGFNNSKNQQVNGGFTGGSETITTVTQVKQMPDDAWVTLQGNIIQQVGEKSYLFKDSTGEVNVKIKSKLWQGQSLTPSDVVKITGEVDTHRTKPLDIEVKKLQIISSAK